jgi:alginate O-acetyltransferase complex protein AlgI
LIFLTYDFVCFALAFFAVYLTVRRWPQARLLFLVGAGLWFQSFYGEVETLLIVLALAVIAYGAGCSGNRMLIAGAIAICAGSLIFFKYTVFLAQSVLAPLTSEAVASAVGGIAPLAIPLGISFFTFEFVHYLVDVYRGDTPIKSVRDFTAFALFWPTIVAGPIKRYQQFVPALHVGMEGQSTADVMRGLCRIAIGFVKKWAADNLTGWIDYIEPNFAAHPMTIRWLFLVALAARILLDFSGYSDMAIGYARIMGIAVPENFNWPYLARSPIEFWQRWHMSLSSWIRDYIYIPLGGNRMGAPRRIMNALAAMTICGLWHGPAWNFAIWGLYHGVGLAMTTGLQRAFRRVEPGLIISGLSWIGTMLFVGIGWLLFFYPVDKAWYITSLLFVVNR